MYGLTLSGYAQLTHGGLEVKSDYFAVVAIIFVMALIAVFLSIMGVFASNERNSTYMQVHVQGVDLFVVVVVVVVVVVFILLASESVIEFFF